MANRKCSNYHYNTDGLFSSQYNENTSVHCGPKYDFPDLMKINNGGAISNEPRINVASGDYYIANNGPYFEDIYTGEQYANGRQTMVKDMSILPMNQAKKAGFKENWTGTYTDFTSKLSPDSGMSSAGRTNTYLIDNVCGKENFLGIETQYGCVIAAVIFIILFIFLAYLLINHYAKKQIGKKIFKGGHENYSFSSKAISYPNNRSMRNTERNRERNMERNSSNLNPPQLLGAEII